MVAEKNKLKEEAVEMIEKIEDEHSLFIVYGTIKAALVRQEVEAQDRV